MKCSLQQFTAVIQISAVSIEISSIWFNCRSFLRSDCLLLSRLSCAWCKLQMQTRFQTWAIVVHCSSFLDSLLSSVRWLSNKEINRVSSPLWGGWWNLVNSIVWLTSSVECCAIHDWASKVWEECFRSLICVACEQVTMISWLRKTNCTLSIWSKQNRCQRILRSASL